MWLTKTYANIVLLRAVLNGNKLWALGIMWVLLSLLHLAVAILLEHAVFGVCPHIICLVWFTTRNRHRNIKSSKRISSIEVDVAAPNVLLLKTSNAHLLRLFSSLFLLQKSHSDRILAIILLLLRPLIIRMVIVDTIATAEPTARELARLTPTNVYLASSPKLVCDAEATASFSHDLLAILLRWWQHLVGVLSSRTLLHIAIKRCLGIRINWNILAPLRLDKRLIVPALEALRQLSRHLLILRGTWILKLWLLGAEKRTSFGLKLAILIVLHLLCSSIILLLLL